MNSVLVSFLILVVLLFVSVTALTCFRTYRVLSERRRNKRLRKFAHENRGKIGQAQNWHCYECQSVMLSNFHIMLDGEGLVALCALCSNSFVEKYRHIYGDDDECKDFKV